MMSVRRSGTRVARSPLAAISWSLTSIRKRWTVSWAVDGTRFLAVRLKRTRRKSVSWSSLILCRSDQG